MKQLLHGAPLSVKITLAISLGQVIYFLARTGLGIMDSADRGTTLVIAAFYLMVTLALAVGAYALLQGRRFGQPLVLVWQLFAFIIGIQTALGGQLLIGAGAVILSGVVILAVCAKSTVDYVTVTPR